MLSDINRNATGTVNIFMNDIVVVVSIAAVVVFGIILINRDSLYENTITKDVIM